MNYSIDHPLFRDAVDLYNFWSALPGQKLRRDLDPISIGARFLRHVSLCHSLDGGNDIRYDLISSTLATAAPRLKPRSLASETTTHLPTIDTVHEILSSVVKQQQVRLIEAHYFSLEGLMRQAIWLLLPIGLDASKPSSEDLMIAVWNLVDVDTTTEETFFDRTQWLLAAAENKTPVTSLPQHSTR